jgi:hypothetical protein
VKHTYWQISRYFGYGCARHMSASRFSGYGYNMSQQRLLLMNCIAHSTSSGKRRYWGGTMTCALFAVAYLAYVCLGALPNSAMCVVLFQSIDH